MTKIRVMTYNIQHGHVHLDDHIDLTRTCDVIRDIGADIIGLNEVRGRAWGDTTVSDASRYTAQVEEMAAYLGYHCYFGRSIYLSGHKPYGNALLSKYPILEASVIRIPNPVDPADIRRFEPRSICRCVVGVPAVGAVPSTFDCPMARLAVYSSHFGLSPAEQEHAVSAALIALGEEALPFVFMGDFNMEPQNPLMQPLHETLNSAAGFIGEKKSHPSHAPTALIDYIYTSRSVTITAADIPRVVASDHCPVWADIEY
ncbi:MAG: hypothetical protein GX628_10375 [Clostridiales bacterium]|nr:hypothetical protein [Clostridiales bacterium]